MNEHSSRSHSVVQLQVCQVKNRLKEAFWKSTSQGFNRKIVL